MRRVFLLACVVLLIGLAGCSEAVPGGDDPTIETEAGDLVDDTEEPTDETESSTTAPEGELEIHHIDVGQADATLLYLPSGETVLIDSGDWRDDGETVIEYLEARGIERIDHLIATHGHADHIGGHEAVIDHFETEGDGIGAAYDSGVPHTSQTYERYLDAIDRHDVEFFTVEEGDTLPLEDADTAAAFLNPPEGDSGGDLHYNSVTLVVQFGETRYLTTGDAEIEAEERMVAEWATELDADIYQAGHHGSSTSSSATFLEAVDPQIAVISSARDSQYGHPHDEVLERFAAHEPTVETYWTGVHGDTLIVTDGQEVAVEPSVSASNDPMDLLAEKHDTDRSETIDPAERPDAQTAAVGG
ncbi:MAG: MBL fold metallo-hydrolase [Natronomonas sp.]